MSAQARKRWLDFAVLGTGVVMSVLLAWVIYSIQVQHQRVEVLAQALADEQSAAEANGLDPVAPEPDDLIDDPELPDPPASPSDEQVQAAVEDYFAEHPVEDGENASPAQIAAAVIRYLTENPPAPGEPGPPPTDEQISNAVAAYLAANPPPAGPPGEDGTDGTNGADGHTPTSEEIQAELDAYLAANPLPMCPSGTTAEARTLLVTDGPPVDAVVCVVQAE